MCLSLIFFFYNCSIFGRLTNRWILQWLVQHTMKPFHFICILWMAASRKNSWAHHVYDDGMTRNESSISWVFITFIVNENRQVVVHSNFGLRYLLWPHTLVYIPFFPTVIFLFVASYINEWWPREHWVVIFQCCRIEDTFKF